MGLDIEKGMTIMDVVEISGVVYCKVRDIRLTKKDTGSFNLKYYASFIKDSIAIADKGYTIEQEGVFTEPWIVAYENLKEELTKEGISHTDN